MSIYRRLKKPYFAQYNPSPKPRRRIQGVDGVGAFMLRELSVSSHQVGGFGGKRCHLETRKVGYYRETPGQRQGNKTKEENRLNLSSYASPCLLASMLL